MKLLLSLFFLLFTPILLSAQSPSEKGKEIAELIQKKNEGFVGEKSKTEMVLIDAYGVKTTRLMEGQVMELEGDGDKSLSTFLNPQDVKGTKMLTWSHKNEDDDQWLYLPSLRRVKRISSSNKSSSFMGSEFTYEDLGSQEIEKYNYTLVKEMNSQGHDVWVLERQPKNKSGYSKQVMYVRKDIFNPIKVEYFDRRGELLKVATFDDYKKHTVNGKALYRAEKIHMKNVQTKKESIFLWKERELGVKHSTRDFDKRRLK